MRWEFRGPDIQNAKGVWMPFKKRFGSLPKLGTFARAEKVSGRVLRKTPTGGWELYCLVKDGELQ